MAPAYIDIDGHNGMVRKFLIFGRFFKYLSVLLFFCGFSALAADRVSGDDAAASGSGDSSEKKPLSSPDEGLDAATVYQLLLAEIAMQRGDIAMASAGYADLALRTRDPGVMERAIVIAGIARNFTVAREIADLWIDADPDSERALELSTHLKIRSRELDGLAPALIRVFRQNSDSIPENLLALNRMMADNPDRRAVFRLVEQVCKAFPKVPEAHYAVALAAETAGEYERASAEARQARRLKPEWEMPVLFQAQLLARRTSKEAAIDSLKEYLAEKPDARNPRQVLARMLLAAERYPEARQHFEHLAEAHPNDPDIIFPLGLLGVQQGDFMMAEARFKHFLTLAPRLDKSYAYYYLGNIAERDKRIDEALEHYSNVTRGESYFPAQFRRVRLMMKQGKPAEARKLLSGIKPGTDNESIQLGLAKADILRQSHQYKAAFDLLDKLLAKRADDPELLYETALLAEKIGRMDILEKRLRRLIELRPDSAQAYNALGYSLADRNIRLSEARELIEKALKFSEEGHILDSMGWVLFRQGDFQGALAYLERALKNLDDPEIVVHLVEALRALGRDDEAQQLLLGARARFPDSDLLKNAIERR
ncbi:MAG: tetratricopeptide repeat protein [Candidatus Accumulibacter sp.]|jgi:tetratricopeptide (TPR) repeat protein|nr:tetratricopeptide repeat protein [Accumulibacter sp.]